MKPKVLAVTGISGSGKTPVCHYLSWETRLHYEPEVSEYLIYQGMKPGVQADPILFDYHIMKMEMNRDMQMMSQLPGWIVETWHPGNVAHMFARSSPLLEEYLMRAKQNMELMNPACIYIEGSVEESTKRSEKLKILGVKKSDYDPPAFLERLVEGYDYAFLQMGIKPFKIHATRKRLEELESESLRIAKDFFGDLKWDYDA